MARILQINCDNPLCYNVIELAADEDIKWIEECLVDFGWKPIDGEDYCPRCSGEEEDN